MTFGIGIDRMNTEQHRDLKHGFTVSQNPKSGFRIRGAPSAAWRTGWILAAFLTVVFVAPGCWVPGPDGPADTYGLDFSLPTGATTQGAIVFIVDGINVEIFDQMLNAGELPAIKKYFVERGLYTSRAVANIPSVTLPNLTSIATGCFPGHHSVVGINWFDRNNLIWRDYTTIAQKNMLDTDHLTPLIYEYFPQDLTFSVFYQPHRGATKFIENWTSAGPPYFFGWYHFVDRLTLSRFDVVMNTARQHARFPAITTVYMLTPDFVAYEAGSDTADYRSALKHTDRQIGRVLGDIQRAGYLDKIVIALVSDHGHWPVKHHFPVDDYLRDKVGLSLNRSRWFESTPYERRLGFYKDVTAVPYGSGDRYWAVCLRKPARNEHGEPIGWESWLDRPSVEDMRRFPACKPGGLFQAPTPYIVDLLQVLVDEPAVDALAYRVDGQHVRVRRKQGEVEFRQAARGEPISYRVIAGQDPLAWSGQVPAEALGGKPRSSRQWLEATAGTEFPDLPAQILAYFRATRRAGDLVMFAAPGYDFGKVNKAGHGGIRPGDMIVPMIVAGPGVPNVRVNAARTADLVPTLLHLLGKPIPPHVDGESLIRAAP